MLTSARAIALATLLLPLAARTSPLVLDQDLRVLRAVDPDFASMCPDQTPSASFADFDAYGACIHGAATQTSSASPTLLTGSATFGTTGGGHSIDLESLYALRFTVDEATPFVFDALFAFDAYDDPFDPPFGANAMTQALARLSFVSTDALALHELLPEIIPPPTWDLAFEHDLPFVTVGDDIVLDGSGVVSEQGILLPGQTYLLEVSERAYREQFVDEFVTGYSFSFAVPEPGTAALLGAGLALLAWGSRRRAR